MPYKITRIEIDKSVVAFIAVDEKQDIAGKCSFKIREGNIIRYQDAFTDERHRGKGVYNMLFNERQKYIDEHYKDYTIQAFCKNSTLRKFLKSGFEVKADLYLVEK